MIYNPGFSQYGGKVMPYIAGGAAFAGKTLVNSYINRNQRVRMKGRYRGAATPTDSVTKRQKSYGSSSFKDRVLKLSEAKHTTNNALTTATHNTVYTWNMTAQVIQGITSQQRIGDKIHLAALKLKGSYQAPTTSGAYTFRIIVGYSGEEFNPVGGPGSGLGTNEIFLPNTTPNWTSNGIINSKAFTMILDERFDLNSLTPDTAEVRSFSHNINLKKDFPYQEAGSVYGKFKNLYVILIGNVVGGVTGTTASGTVQMAFDLIFKDL